MSNARVWILSSLLLSSCATDEPLATEVQAAGNSEAAKCCKELFPPGPLRGQCISQAAHGEGPCANAGVIDAGVVEVIDAAVVVDAEVPAVDAAVVP